MGQCCTQQQLPIKMSNQRVIQHYFYKCQIDLVTGDLLEQKSDAIVAQTDPSLSMNSKLARRIKQLGGQDMMMEILSFGSVSFGDVLPIPMDDNSKLQCEYLILAILPCKSMECKLSQFETMMRSDSQQSNNSNPGSDKQYVFKTIYSILQQCQRYQLCSLSFPVLHAENVRGSEDVTPYLMLLAIKTYLEETQNTPAIEKINIIIKDKSLISNFKWAFSKIFMPESNEVNQNNFLLDTEQKQSVRELVSDSGTNENFSHFGRSYQSSSVSSSKRKESI